MLVFQVLVKTFQVSQEMSRFMHVLSRSIKIRFIGKREIGTAGLTVFRIVHDSDEAILVHGINVRLLVKIIRR